MSEEMEYVLRNVIEQKEKEIKDLRERLDFEKYTVCQMNALGEALKVKLRRHKFKRCLAMAKWCRMHDEFTQLESERLGLPQRTLFLEYRRKAMWWNKWHNRWLELAEKFKEAK